MIGLLGIFLTLNRRPWIPDFVGRREISYETLTKLTAKAQAAIKKLERWLHPRYEILCVHPVLHKLHGITIAVMAAVLMIPLPLPLSNTVAAVPVFLIALGMLEEDGGFVIAGYVSTLGTVAYYGLLLWMGLEGFRKLFGL
jgi:hypothetical protein